jgi:hypothetical protein
VKCGSYSQYLSVWSKVTLGYAIEFWKDSIDNFPSYDWIMYNNKRLKQVDLREDIMEYRDYSTIYLRVSLAGSGKEEEKIAKEKKTIEEYARMTQKEKYWNKMKKRNPRDDERKISLRISDITIKFVNRDLYGIPIPDSQRGVIIINPMLERTTNEMWNIMEYMEHEILNPPKVKYNIEYNIVEDPPVDNISSFVTLKILYKVAKKMGIIKSRISGRKNMDRERMNAIIKGRNTTLYQDWVKNFDAYADKRAEILKEYFDYKKILLERRVKYHGKKECYEMIKSKLYPARSGRYPFVEAVSYWMKMKAKVGYY